MTRDEYLAEMTRIDVSDMDADGRLIARMAAITAHAIYERAQEGTYR